MSKYSIIDKILINEDFIKNDDRTWPITKYTLINNEFKNKFYVYVTEESINNPKVRNVEIDIIGNAFDVYELLIQDKEKVYNAIPIRFLSSKINETYKNLHPDSELRELCYKTRADEERAYREQEFYSIQALLMRASAYISESQKGYNLFSAVRDVADIATEELLATLRLRLDEYRDSVETKKAR